MKSADFTHKIVSQSGRDIIVIEDLNIGGRSVTNDIENVIASIAKMEKINPDNYMIVYRDSDGIWDGWDNEGKHFVPLWEDNWQDAVSKFVQLQLNTHSI